MFRSSARRSVAVLAATAMLVVACGVTPTPSDSTPVTSVSTMSPSFDPALADRLSEALEIAVRDSGAPGAQAAVVLADGSRWTAGAGRSTDDQPMTPDLLTAIGSVTKVYTAALALDLAHDEVLSIDDRLARWLPDAPNSDGVTIRQLLTHTSGLASDDSALPRVCDPGTCYSYSNSGFDLLGQVIEAATGRSYAEALRERILTPLELGATFFPGQEPVVGSSATGHAGTEMKLAVDVAMDASAERLGASGAIVATASDAAWFAHGLFSGDLLDPAGLATMLDFEATRGLPGTSDCAGWGMVGLRRSTDLGDSWFHGGSVGFFRSWVEHFPRHGVTVAVVVNADMPPIAVSDPLAQIALADAPEVGPEPTGRCNEDVAIRAADGTVHLVTGEPGFDGLPSWSPDGTRIAWVANRDDRNDLFVSDLDGSHRTRLTDDPAMDVFPRWSPDGRAIAFSSDRDGDLEIYLMAPDGGDVRQLTHNGWNDVVATWSPDGSQLAYVSFDGGQHIRLMNPDGSGDRALTSGDGREWWPAWSPDGRRIAYESGGVIFVIPIDGGDPVRLPIPQIRVTMFPSWAPSPTILFSSDGDLYAVAEDGTNLVRLTTTSMEETTPAWGPDGRSIAFQVSRWEPGEPPTS